MFQSDQMLYCVIFNAIELLPPFINPSKFQHFPKNFLQFFNHLTNFDNNRISKYYDHQLSETPHSPLNLMIARIKRVKEDQGLI